MDIILKPNCGKPITQKKIQKKNEQLQTIKRYCASKNSIPLCALDYGKIFVSDTYYYTDKNGKIILFKKFHNTNIEGPYWYTIHTNFNKEKMRIIENDMENNKNMYFSNKIEYKVYYCDELFDESYDDLFQYESFEDKMNSESSVMSDDLKSSERAVIEQKQKSDENNINNISNEDFDEDGNEVLGLFYNPKKKEIM